MFVIPAIDLVDGKCVRLIQGDFHRRIEYQDNPVEQARRFIAEGARWLHVVDLDGAKLGRPVNTQAIQALTQLEELNIEVGGGVRDTETVRMLLSLGVKRVIIGTRAVDDFEWFSQTARQFSGQIVLGLDAKGLRVSTHGWTKNHSRDLLDFVVEAGHLPLSAIIYTDISKDGMMAGPNLERTRKLAQIVEVPVVASGGVNSVEDIKKLKEIDNIEAAIIGRALYEGNIRLSEAIKACGG